MTNEVFSKISALALNKLNNLDVNLTYHCKDHTLDVLEQCERIGLLEGINVHEMLLLKVAALYHDCGFLESYADHESHSCKLFLNDIEPFNFSQEDKDIITGLIMATKVPQQPQTLLQRIICDSDLDYLGRPDFFEIGQTLKKEFLHFNIVANDEAWHNLQLKFLNNHHYHTKSSQILREPVKQENIKALL